MTKFEVLLNRVSPRLRKIARFHNGHGRFIDGDDLYQEMCWHLWNNYGLGIPDTVNDSYMVKGCEFHLRNYLRKTREKAYLLSMEKPLDEAGTTLRDLIPDSAEPLDWIVEKSIVIDNIKNNGFSKREKDVFSYLLEGYTVREISGKLDISHVMVVKYKKSLIKKWRCENMQGYQIW